VVKNIKLERRELIGETVDKELYKMQWPTISIPKMPWKN
jgi:hypothetical protein